MPTMGAELDASIGYDQTVQRMGLFICNEVELKGFPGSMTIRANGAPFEASKGGKSQLQSQKTRSWAKGTTLEQMIARIAAEHGLQPAVSKDLASIKLPATAQSQESDMNLLLRLAKLHDAVAKPAGGKLLFVKRGEGQSASGQSMRRVTLTPLDGSEYVVNMSAKGKTGTTIAYYRDTKAATRQEVKVGSGEPQVRLRMSYANRGTAEAAAKAKHAENARAMRSLDYTLPGRPELSAESVVVMQGFRDGVDGEWLVNKATHTISSTGYSTKISCSLPNSAPEVKQAREGVVDETTQVGTEV